MGPLLVLDMHMCTPVRRQEDRHTDTCRVMQLLRSFHPLLWLFPCYRAESQPTTFSLCQLHPLGLSQVGPGQSPQCWGGVPHSLPAATFHFMASQSPESITSAGSDPRNVRLVSAWKTGLGHCAFPFRAQDRDPFQTPWISGWRPNDSLSPGILNLSSVTAEPRGQGISTHIFLLFASLRHLCSNLAFFMQS